MDLAELQVLKQKLLHDEKLAPVWSYFMDHFADHREFIALGERINDSFVEAVLAQVSQQLFGADGAVHNLILTGIPEQHFLHGGFGMGGRFGGVIYFEDAQVGLLAVPVGPPSAEVKYARFSGRFARLPGDPSLN
ncbi:MAG: hypothetical protein JWO38_7371 [Gemmataceae bacterium]|nr:hypothetical protein [Gemmataceae bacterium]